jgi:hypothetical protein
VTSSTPHTFGRSVITPSLLRPRHQYCHCRSPVLCRNQLPILPRAKPKWHRSFCLGGSIGWSTRVSHWVNWEQKLTCGHSPDRKASGKAEGIIWGEQFCLTAILSWRLGLKTTGQGRTSRERTLTYAKKTNMQRHEYDKFFILKSQFWPA